MNPGRGEVLLSSPAQAASVSVGGGGGGGGGGGALGRVMQRMGVDAASHQHQGEDEGGVVDSDESDGDDLEPSNVLETSLDTLVVAEPPLPPPHAALSEVPAELEGVIRKRKALQVNTRSRSG